MNKIKVYHFHNGKGGGVLSVIRNLLQYSNNPLIENHVIYTINKEQTPVFTIEHIKGAVTEQIFYYSPKWNFYYTCRQLAKLLPDDKALVVAHDWLELGMMSNLGLQNPVVIFLHGDYEYYFQLAILHQASIDSFIAISNSIEVKLIALIPARKTDIHYLRFPVPSFAYLKRDKQNTNIVYIGRLAEGKGYFLLPQIDRLLKEKSIQLNWHIVGEEQKNNDFEACWEVNTSLHLYGEVKNEDVMALLQNMDFFILPSTAEGMPVSLIEAMKAGAIPFVNNIEGGIQELVDDNITGFKIMNNDPSTYADCIEYLIQNKSLSAKISSNCIEVSNKLFDPYQNTQLIEAEIRKVTLASLRNKKPKKVYGSRLDQKWIPNLLTRVIRSIK